MSDTQDPETPIAGGGTVPPTPLQDDSLQRELISSELTGRQDNSSPSSSQGKNSVCACQLASQLLWPAKASSIILQLSCILSFLATAPLPASSLAHLQTFSNSLPLPSLPAPLPEEGCTDAA